MHFAEFQLYVIYTMLTVVGTFATHIPESDETRLFRHLKSGYMKESRPVLNASDTVQVSVSMKVSRLDELNTKYQFISVVGWMSTTWHDYRLTWNPADFGGLDVVTMLPTEIWVPTYVISNTASNHFYDEFWFSLFKVKVSHDGSMYWSPGGAFKAQCQIDVYLFPFDDQICNFRFENWVYTGDKVNLTHWPTAEEDLLSFYNTEHGQWDMIGSKVTRVDFYYDSSPFPFAMVHFGLHLRRKALFYVTNIILLSVLLAVLVLFMLKLPSESGERISMGVTLLLAFSVFILMINDSIPETSTSVPIIIVYLVCFMAVTSLGICTSVIALYCFHHSGKTGPPAWMTSLMKKPCRRSYKVKSMANDGVKGGDPVEDNVTEWQRLSRWVDSVVFWLALLCFLLLMLVLLIIIPFSTPLKDLDTYSKKW